MRFYLCFCAALVGLLALTLSVGSVYPDENKPNPPSNQNLTPEQTKKAIEQGLVFLEKDAVKWKQERQCSTCHHGTMTLWALNEAKSHGYAVAAESMADVTKWAKERLKDIDKARDTRMGWNMVNTPALYMNMMAQAVPKQEAVSPDELKKIAGHLLRHQEADGSWAWSIAPPKNRPPPHFESDEVVTLMAYLALGPHVDLKEKSPVREGHGKAAAWLAKTKPSDTTQADGLRLLVKVRAGESAKNLQLAINEFLKRQNKDGGWGQLKDLPSDAYATGQALYCLSLAKFKNDRAEIQRAVAFLVGNQKADGSWPMTPRAHPEATPSRNPVPIIYFGSAWATLGMLRSVQK